MGHAFGPIRTIIRSHDKRCRLLCGLTLIGWAHRVVGYHAHTHPIQWTSLVTWSQIQYTNVHYHLYTNKHTHAFTHRYNQPTLECPKSRTLATHATHHQDYNLNIPHQTPTHHHISLQIIINKYDTWIMTQYTPHIWETLTQGIPHNTVYKTSTNHNFGNSQFAPTTYNTFSYNK